MLERRGRAGPPVVTETSPGPPAARHHFEQFQASIYVNAPLFDKCTGFAEYYVLAPDTDGSDAAHYADFGEDICSPAIQLDARVGFGLNNEADNFFTGVGLSVLF